MSEVDKKSGFWRGVNYSGWSGNIIGKQLPLEINGMVAGYLVAFRKPTQEKGETDEAFKTRLANFAEVFQCDPEHLGPCVNRIIPEGEIEFNEPD